MSPTQGTITIFGAGSTDDPASVDCNNPLTATVSNRQITAVKAGDQNGTFNVDCQSRQVSFTNNFRVTDSVGAASANGAVQSITITGGSASVTIQGNGPANAKKNIAPNESVPSPSAMRLLIFIHTFLGQAVTGSFRPDRPHSGRLPQHFNRRSESVRTKRSYVHVVELVVTYRYTLAVGCV